MPSWKKVIISGSDASLNTLNTTQDSVINGINIGRGGGNVSSNTRVGVQALIGNTTGTFNTAIGYEALRDNTVGGGNVAIGSFAGVGDAYANTSGSNSIYIGNSTNSSYFDSINEIVIGTGITGFGSNSTLLGNQSTTKTIIYGNLLLGQTFDNGVHKLQITGRALISENSTINSVTIGRGNGDTGGNTIIGEGTGGSINQTGQYNTVVGWAAFQQNNSGFSNTAIGAGSLSNNVLGSNNTALGYYSLVINQSGSNNTSIGHETLRSINTGDNNVALGQASLYSLVSGSNNTAVGQGSLFLFNRGTNNTALGQASLISMVTGSSNTATGQGSLRSFIIGDNNTVSGNSSLFNLLSGSNNTAVGQGSLFSATTGSNNTALGQNTLYSTTTGTNNTAIGQGSMFNNTTGTNNVSAGQNTLLSNSVGANNTAYGQSSLSNNTSGSNNIAIGRQAGTFLPDKSTAASILNNSIMIGTRTSPLNSNHSNQIVIGHDSNGLGNNTTVLGNASTLSTAIYGDLLLGQTTDNGTDRLQVTGTGVFTGNLTAAAFLQSSDIRLKDIISQEGDVITYKWKDGRDSKTHIGYSAQEVQQIMPDSVNQDNGGILSVNYIEVLVKKVQDLENRIKQLEN